MAISGKLRQLRQIFSAPKFVRIRYLRFKIILKLQSFLSTVKTPLEKSSNKWMRSNGYVHKVDSYPFFTILSIKSLDVILFQVRKWFLMLPAVKCFTYQLRSCIHGELTTLCVFTACFPSSGGNDLWRGSSSFLNKKLNRHYISSCC